MLASSRERDDATDVATARAPSSELGVTPPSGARGRFMTDVLVELCGISRARIEDAVRDAGLLGTSPERLLVEQGIITSEQMARAMAERFGLDYLDLSQYEVDMAAANMISLAAAKRHGMVPVRFVDESTLLVAMEDPANVVALDDLALSTGMRVRAAAAAGEDIAAVITRMTRFDNAVADVMEEDEEAQATQMADELNDGVVDTPIVKLVNSILAQAVDRGASDIHFEAGASEMRVRFRVDGVLVDAATIPRRMVAGVVSRVKIMAEMDIAERRLPQDGRVTMRFEGRQIDLRVVTLPSVHGESAVLRVLDRDGTAIELSGLGMAESDLRRFEASVSRSYGAVLVTGPTGSGKSTTLYGAVALINSPEKNIVTIEDPVEYRLEGITQVPVNARAGLTFATGLRSMMRADPDVILVGEVRDRETAHIAIESALTGHLVLTTLHTNDAPSAVTRLGEMGIEPFLVASSVFCVVAQRLARTLCRSCKQQTTMSVERLRANGFDVAQDATVYVPTGCATCGGTGYRGRLGLFEVMPVTPRIRELILERASADAIGRAAIEEGMRPLRQDGLAKVLAGKTSIDEVLRVSGGES
ncbi:MAG TPA: ATPase, T2SS/T4P/T4SS family [Solirubrobacteraceae bacterium]|jgi:type IV pilus assembly protein PilB|nr:ATPase, T2SS/T4P/T4SS family [Solirubrobacteraceae bacterium]